MLTRILILIAISFGATSSTTQAQDKLTDHRTLKGLWYLADSKNNVETYTRQKSSSPSFHIKRSEITYTHCTDMCGCMPVIYYGNYELKKNTLSVTYKNKTLADPRGKGIRININTIVKKIQVIEVTNDTLRIKAYKHH